MKDDILDIDAYQARMLIAFYLSGKKDQIGTMEAFVRKLPPNRNFLVVAGLQRIITYLRDLKFTHEDIDILKMVLPDVPFNKDLETYLLNLDFTILKIRAMSEGEIAFEKEPFISITGPIGMLQYIEKKILSILNHDIRIASKAARIVIAAHGRPLSDFGGRRGADKMSAEAARAAYIGGFNSTSNVLAYKKYGIPAIGTMGHVWVMSFKNEQDAYLTWSDLFTKSSYLPDTYDTINGVEKLEPILDNIDSIRLDSGDLLSLSKEIRKKLDESQKPQIKIGATNDLDEYSILELIRNNAPIDWFGVGTQLVSTPDSPSCGIIYKLVEQDDEPVAKIAAGGKGTLPCAKNVVRILDSKLEFVEDIIVKQSEVKNLEKTKCKLLLKPIGIWKNFSDLNDRRDYCLANLELLPYNLKYSSDFIYPVKSSIQLTYTYNELIKKYGQSTNS